MFSKTLEENHKILSVSTSLYSESASLLPA